MTDRNPNLREYISDVQADAMRLQGILDVLAYLNNEEGCGTGRSVLVDLAAELAKRINSKRDGVALCGET